MELAKILERIKIYLRQIQRRWLLMLLVCIIGGVICFVYAFLSQGAYETYATFHPDTGQAGGISLANNPLSMIFGQGVEDGQSNQMIGVLNSRRVSESVVKDTIMHNEAPMLLADLIIQTGLEAFSISKLFSSPKGPSSLKNKVVKSGKTIRKQLNVETTETGFIKMTFSSYTPELTQIISRKYIDKLQEYYKDQKTEKARSNLEFYEKLSDSIKQELDVTATKVARFEDQNSNLVYAKSRVSQAEQQIKLVNLQEMYKTLIVNREQARSQLLLDTPVIQVLDWPNPPFTPKNKSPLIYTIFGCIMGLLVGSILATYSLLKEDIAQLIQESLDLSDSKP